MTSGPGNSGFADGLAESARPAHAAPRRRGQVLILTLLAMTLLAGLIFYVYNLGYQVNNRTELQHAADASAVSGATWMARSMNVVAMNNVGQSKMLSAAITLDSLPLATDISLDEATAWEAALAAQQARLGGIALDANVKDKLSEGLEALHGRMARQRDILAPMDQVLNHSTFQMAKTTTWDVRGVGGAPPHGKVWQAAVTMDELSQATVNSAGVLAQADAARWGRQNDAQTAFIVPVLPRIPARRGTFQDFKPVLAGQENVYSDRAEFLDGGNGGAIPDGAHPHRLGPWARLMRWRYSIAFGDGHGVHIPSDTQVRGGGGVQIIGRRVGSTARTQANDTWIGGRSTVIGYRTYGPLHQALRMITNWAGGDNGALSDTFFADYMQRLSRIKLEYMFGSKELQRIHRPSWQVDYPQAKATAQQPNVRVTQTMFYLIEIASSVPESDGDYLSPGTFRANLPPPDDRRHRPIAIWVDGWSDPATWGIPSVGNYIWKDQYTYETTNDPEIGIRPRDLNGDSSPDFQTVYMASYYVFGGIDIGGEVIVDNPCNWEDGETLPAPVLMEASSGHYEDGDQTRFRCESFKFLGVARGNSHSPVWPSQFGNPSPNGKMLAIAQAQVFNTTSWDLWTQDWRAQLMPVTNLPDWTAQMAAGAPDAAATDGAVQQSDVEAVAQFLETLDEQMAEKYINH